MTTEVIPQTLPDSLHGMSVERAQALLKAVEALYDALHMIDDNASCNFHDNAGLSNWVWMDGGDPVASAQSVVDFFNNAGPGAGMPR